MNPYQRLAVLILAGSLAWATGVAAVEVPLDIAAALPPKTAPEVRRLVRLMTTPGDLAERARASGELAARGEEAVVPLLWLLRLTPRRMASYRMVEGVLGKVPVTQPAADPVIVAHITDALAAVGLPAVDPLVDLLRDPRPAGKPHLEELVLISPKTGETIWLENPVLSRERGVSALTGIGPKALPALAEHYRGGETGLRRHIVDVFVRMSDPLNPATAGRAGQVVPYLNMAVDDADERIRLEAVRRLEDVADARSTDFLIRALQDRDIRVRISAAAALGRTGDPRAVTPLLGAVKTARGDMVPGVARGLTRLWRHEQAFEALMEIFRGPDTELRRAAWRLLEKETGQKLWLDTEAWGRWRREALAIPTFEGERLSAVPDCRSSLCHAALPVTARSHPLVAEGACRSCHEVPDRITVHRDRHALMPGVRETECAGCHEAASAAAGRASTHGPISEGLCLPCHAPHDPIGPSLLRKWGYLEPDFPAGPLDGYEGPLCLGCHDRDAFETGKQGETGFKDGDTNLHVTHLNYRRSPRCLTCHDPHGSVQEVLLKTSIPFGRQWTLPLEFTKTPAGGSCRTGCHRVQKYVR